MGQIYTKLDCSPERQHHHYAIRFKRVEGEHEGTKVVTKSVNQSTCESVRLVARQQILSEIALLRLLNHPNVACLAVEPVCEGPSPSLTISSGPQLCECWYQTSLNGRNFIEETDLRNVATKALAALSHIHAMNVAHGAVATCNFVVPSYPSMFHLKLTNFDEAAVVMPRGTQQWLKRNDVQALGHMLQHIC